MSPPARALLCPLKSDTHLLSSALTTSVFLTCTPFASTGTGTGIGIGTGTGNVGAAATATTTATVTSTYTTTYTFVALAACPTSTWPATYTIEEVCTGNPATFTPPAIPHNFVETTVVCNVCATPTMTITCPVASASQTGDMIINGNGVTAGAAGEITSAPSMTGEAVPGSTYVTAGAPRSLKTSLALLGTFALVAGQILL